MCAQDNLLVVKPGVAMPLPIGPNFQVPFTPNFAQPGPSALAVAIMARLNRIGISDQIRALETDLLWKYARGDMHGVSDAANDVRVEEVRR